jgi:hypothetical protein
MRGKWSRTRAVAGETAMSCAANEKCLDHGNFFDCPLLGHFNVGRKIVMLPLLPLTAMTSRKPSW